MSSRKEDNNPLLIKIAVGVGVAAVSGIAAMLFYKHTQEERPHHNNFAQDSRTCSICLDTLANKRVIFLTCGHIFHENCINSWKRQKNICPMCREAID